MSLRAGAKKENSEDNQTFLLEKDVRKMQMCQTQQVRGTIDMFGLIVEIWRTNSS